MGAGQVLTYADCAVNPSPDAEQLARIATSSADTAAAFGLEPRVALLSYSTLGSGSGPDVDLVSLLSSCWTQRKQGRQASPSVGALTCPRNGGLQAP